MTRPPQGDSAPDVRCVAGRDALDRLAQDLDRLNAASTRPDPFSTADYLRAYVDRSEYFPDGMDVRLFVLTDGHEVVGIVPMRSVTDRFPAGLRSRRLEFLATHDNERPHIICRAGDEDRIARAFVDHVAAHRGWSLVELRGQPVGSPLWRAAHAASGARRQVRDVPIGAYSEVALHHGDLVQYYAGLSKRMRSNISRQGRRLFRAGDVELLIATGPDACSALFDEYLELEDASWKFRSDASVRRHPQRVAFFREVAAGRAGSDPSLVAICLDGVMVAALLSAHHGKGMWALEMAYDELHSDLGPGQLLLLVATGLALERNHRFFNFLQNYGYYKQRWQADSIDVVNVQLLRRPGLHHVKGLVGDWRRRHVTGDDVPRPPMLTNDDRHAAVRRNAEHPSRAGAASRLAGAIERAGPGVHLLRGAAATGHLPFSVG